MLSLLGLCIIPGLAQALDIKAPFVDGAGNPLTDITFDAKHDMGIYVGVANLSGALESWSVEVNGRALAFDAIDDNNRKYKYKAEFADDGTNLVIRAKDSGQEKMISYTVHIQPFDVRRYAGPSSNVEVQRGYNKINLMTYLMGDATFNEIFATPLLVLLEGAGPVEPLKTKLQQARGHKLVTADTLTAAHAATDNAIEALKVSDIKGKTVGEFFLDDFRDNYPGNIGETLRVVKVYEELKTLARTGIDLPFATHEIYRGSLAGVKVVNRATQPAWKENIEEFLTAYLAAFGGFNESQLYTDPAPNAAAEEIMLEANIRRVVLTALPDVQSSGGYVVTGEGDETKQNSKVCGQVYNGSTYVYTCLTCIPAVQSFCSMTAEGSCTTSSNPGPCSLYPPVTPP
jgi:hypothetical protein